LLRFGLVAGRFEAERHTEAAGGGIDAQHRRPCSRSRWRRARPAALSKDRPVVEAPKVTFVTSVPARVVDTTRQYQRRGQQGDAPGAAFAHRSDISSASRARGLIFKNGRKPFNRQV